VNVETIKFNYSLLPIPYAYKQIGILIFPYSNYQNILQTITVNLHKIIFLKVGKALPFNSSHLK